MTKYWIFNGVDEPPTPITFLGTEDNGWFRFIDENGDEDVERSDFLEDLDTDPFNEDGDYLWGEQP